MAEALERLPAVAGDWMEAPAEFSIPESLRARVECGQMVIREASVAFLAIPKHTSTYVYTAEVPLPVLEKVAGAYAAGTAATSWCVGFGSRASFGS